MKKFRVILSYMYTDIFDDVEAEDEDAAIKIAEGMPSDPVYSCYYDAEAVEIETVMGQ